MSIKRWFCAGLVLGSGIVPAQGADLTDLDFLPFARQLVGTTSFGYGVDSGDLDDVSGLTQSSRDSHTQALTQSINYGITSRLSVFGALSHTWTTARYDFAGRGRSIERVGSQSLMIGLTGRLLEQQDHPFDLDVTATVPGTLSVALGRELENMTIRAVAGVYHAGGGRGFDLVRGMDVDVGRFWGYQAGLQAQMRWTSAISLNLSVQYISSNVDNARGTADGTTFTIQFPDQVNFGAALNYQLIPHRLAMQLGASYQLLGRRRDLYGDPTQDLATAHRIRHAVGLGFIYSMNGR